MLIIVRNHENSWALSFTAKRKDVDPDKEDSVLNSVMKNVAVTKGEISEVLVIKNDLLIARYEPNRDEKGDKGLRSE